MNVWMRTACTACFVVCQAAVAQGQAAAFPSKPIRIYVPFNAGSGADSNSRFYGEMFGQQVLAENKPGGSGVVAVQGGAQMLTDVVGGQLEVGVIDFGGTLELMKGGRLRVLAITGDKREPKYPDIPTMKESGFPEFETWVWSAFFVRAETPTEIVDKLAAAVNKAMTSEEGRAYQATLPSAPLMMGPRELGEFQLREDQRFKRVAELAGISPE